jgi:hypothetical protein
MTWGKQREHSAWSAFFCVGEKFCKYGASDVHTQRLFTFFILPAYVRYCTKPCRVLLGVVVRMHVMKSNYLFGTRLEMTRSPVTSARKTLMIKERQTHEYQRWTSGTAIYDLMIVMRYEVIYTEVIPKIQYLLECRHTNKRTFSETRIAERLHTTISLSRRYTTDTATLDMWKSTGCVDHRCRDRDMV